MVRRAAKLPKPRGRAHDRSSILKGGGAVRLTAEYTMARQDVLRQARADVTMAGTSTRTPYSRRERHESPDSIQSHLAPR
jgi:hypothetical protein